MSEELKLAACPFCGKEREIQFTSERWSFVGNEYLIKCCYGLEIREGSSQWTPKKIEETKQRLIEAWNTRPIEDSLNQRVKELEEQVFALSTGTRDQRHAERIKEQEATIDALLNQNKTQMEELEKLEAWQLKAIPSLRARKLSAPWAGEKEFIDNLIKQAEDN